MRKLTKPTLGVCLLAWVIAAWVGHNARSETSLAAIPPDRDTSVDVLFSPEGGCEERIVSEIESAKKRLRMQAYYFTSKPVSQAIIDAHRRGVECEVIVDASQENMTYGRLPALRREGVKVFIDAKHAIANNKIVLIDERTIITGSYNFTKAAEEKNAENLLVITHFRELFEKYAANFEEHKKHSRKYQGSSK